MISNFKFLPYFNILQNFVENVRKTKKPSILSCTFRTKHATILPKFKKRHKFGD